MSDNERGALTSLCYLVRCQAGNILSFVATPILTRRRFVTMALFNGDGLHFIGYHAVMLLR